jgi:hypothetical protein
MLTSLVTYYLVDEKSRVTKDLDIPYSRAQCNFQAMNQSKVLSSIVCKFSAMVLANNSPAICSCGADQNCHNSSVYTRSPSSIKEQSVWEGFLYLDYKQPQSFKNAPVIQLKESNLLQIPLTSSYKFKEIEITHVCRLRTNPCS